MKTTLLEKQLNWFFPYQEEEFIQIFNDTKKNKLVICSLHFFIPTSNIKLENTDDLKRIIEPKENKKDINITKTEVSNTDIYIEFNIYWYIDKDNWIWKILEKASQYLIQLEKESWKKTHKNFPKWENKEITKDIISIIETNWVLSFPWLTISVNIEEDMSYSIMINKSEKSIKEKNKDFDSNYITIEKYAKENWLERINADDSYLEWIKEKYFFIYSIWNFDKTWNYRNVDNVDILIKELKTLLNII